MGLPATKLGLKVPPAGSPTRTRASSSPSTSSRFNDQPYPDRGVNLELFTNNTILEMESLAPHNPLPAGQTRHHVEHWVLPSRRQGTRR